MPSGKAPRRQCGYTYVAMLLAVAVIGMGLAATGMVWSQASQREKERELLFVGDQFRQAIERFYERSPGVKRYPKTLEELTADARFPRPERHLRRIYADPLTGKPDWTLIEAPGGGIMGVKSKSAAAPIKTGLFTQRDRVFQEAKSYQDWEFFHDAQPATTPAGSQSPAPSGSSPASGPSWTPQPSSPQASTQVAPRTGNSAAPAAAARK